MGGSTPVLRKRMNVKCLEFVRGYVNMVCRYPVRPPSNPPTAQMGGLKSPEGKQGFA